MTKTQAVLEFLQEKAVYLRTLPNLSDAQCQNGKLLLLFRNEVPELPQFTHKGVKLTTITQITTEEQKPTASPTEAYTKAQKILEKHNVSHDRYNHQMSEAISPSSNKFNDLNSYNNWKKRFNKE